MKQFAAAAALILLAALALLVGFVGAAMAQAPVTRQVTTGCTHTATSKDYSGTISWRSPTNCAKTETLPACNSYSSGKWIQLVDGQGTATAFPITINTLSGTVSGPTLPVVIATDRNAFVLTCDGAAAQWLVTAIAGVPGTGGGGGGGTAMMIDATTAILVSPGVALLVQ